MLCTSEKKKQSNKQSSNNNKKTFVSTLCKPKDKESVPDARLVPSKYLSLENLKWALYKAKIYIKVKNKNIFETRSFSGLSSFILMMTECRKRLAFVF